MVGRASVVWWPEALHHVAAEPEALKDFAYVVLEELVDEEVVLMSWSWPHADRQGHLYWRGGKVHEPSTAVVGRNQLRHQLYQPSRLKRLPRLGDVYAATRLGPGWAAEQPVPDVRTLFDGPVYDISADAREAAKLAYLGAVATVRAPRRSSDLDHRLLGEARQHRTRLRAKALKLSPPQSSRGRRRP